MCQRPRVRWNAGVRELARGGLVELASMVTAHMKEAGVKELFSYERGSGRADDVVAAIY